MYICGFCYKVKGSMENETKNRKKIRLQGFDYNKTGAIFLTICTKNRRCILSKIVGTGVPDGPIVELLPYGRIAKKYIEQLNDFYDKIDIVDYVIMPNHIHLLLFTKGEDIGPSGTPVPTVQNSLVSRFVSTFKRFCNKEYGENIWQYRSNDHIIRNRKDYEKHCKYIIENPLYWQYDKLYGDK